MNALNLLKEHENVIKERFGLKKLGIFGSFARGEALDKSDVDVLVEFSEGKKTFDNFMEIKFYLEEHFEREVDLVIETAIKPKLKDYIMREAVYA
ncbi:nucleotidyltransferase family protein [Methanolobus bombayensis]|uniref:nucleotidyltransferase family protein n=1 Tax=Methanolobus bombayensis TaxID=38023 RepID=UPI001AE19F33|nr:nucleotidyltransferase family protein [Methanolobus bombayensis]MBP1909622.1 putative nucleotidyltransferase [Methanolobus bombayensis]